VTLSGKKPEFRAGYPSKAGVKINGASSPPIDVDELAIS